MIRVILMALSIIGLLAYVALSVFVLVMTHGWDGHASMPLAVAGGLIGFLVASVATVFGYSREWYRFASVSGVLLLMLSALPWLGTRDALAGVAMLSVAALWAVDIWRNHESGKAA